MTSDVDTLPLIQAIETLKEQKTKLLEDKVEYLNQKIVLIEQQHATAINNLATRVQQVEKFLQQVIEAGKSQQKPLAPPPPISFPPEKSPARKKAPEG